MKPCGYTPFGCVLFALMPLFGGGAKAQQNLLEVAESGNGNIKWALRTDRISKGLLSNTSNVWIMAFARHPVPNPNLKKPYSSIAHQMNVDCENGTYSTVQIVFYDSSAVQIQKSEGNPLRYEQPVPDTIAESILKETCRFLDGRPKPLGKFP